MIDEHLQKKLLRQLRILNIWMSFFGTLVLTALIIGGWVLFQLWSVTQSATSKIENVTEKVKAIDVKESVCTGDSTFSKYLQQKTDACK